MKQQVSGYVFKFSDLAFWIENIILGKVDDDLDEKVRLNIVNAVNERLNGNYYEIRSVDVDVAEDYDGPELTFSVSLVTEDDEFTSVTLSLDDVFKDIFNSYVTDFYNFKIVFY